MFILNHLKRIQHLFLQEIFHKNINNNTSLLVFSIFEKLGICTRCRLTVQRKKERNKESRKNSQNDKIENVADLVWLSLFMEGNVKCKLPSTPPSTGLIRIQHFIIEDIRDNILRLSYNTNMIYGIMLNGCHTTLG
jgi:hypothetical protein